MCDEALNAQLKHDAAVTVASKKDPLERVQAKLLKRGASSFKALSRLFRIMDDDHNHQIGPEEFSSAMKMLDVVLTKEELTELFMRFDSDQSGTINMTEFSVALMPKMNKTRKEEVHKAFIKMDRSGDGEIDVDDLALFYRVQEHPKFKSGEWTEKQVLRNFLDVFDAKDHSDGKVTLQEFMSYYACLSACIDNDMYFKLMMTNAWGE